MTNYFFGGILTLFTALSSMTVLSLFGYKKRTRQSPFWICTIVLSLLGALVEWIGGETGELLAELLLMVSAVGLMYLRFHPKKKLTFFWFGLLLCSLVDFCESMIASAFSVTSRIAVLLLYCGIYGALLILCVIADRLQDEPPVPDFLEQIPVAIYIVIFVANYSAFYSVTLKNNAESYAGVASVLHALSAVFSTCCIVYLIFRFVVLSGKQKEEARIHAMELGRYEEMIRGNSDIRAFRHDYKNNLFAVDALLSSGRTEQAQEFIRQMTQSLEQTKGRFQTGNVLSDAILSDKATKADALQIVVDFDGAIPGVGIQDRDLCTVLSNGLDNAIEACKSQAPCTIKVRATTKSGGTVIRILNPVSSKVSIRGGLVQTSKKDKQNHGFGLSNIRRAAERSGGYLEVSCSAEQFTLEAGFVHCT